MVAKATAALSAIFIVIITVMIVTTTTWQVPEIENYLEYQPYTYNASKVYESQEKRFLWWFDFTQVQYKVTNTDVYDGTFSLNCVFDDGKKTQTTTNKVKIAPGEAKIVVVNSPLGGHSSVTATLTPPNKAIPKQRTVMKTVSTLDYVGLGWLLKFFK